MWRKCSVCLLLAWMLLAPVSVHPTGAGATLADTPPHLGYGMMLAFPPAHLGLVHEAGFDWYKYFTYWNALDPERDRVYAWDSLDGLLDDACEHGLHLLLRVERDPNNWTPIRDAEMPGWEALFTDLAAHIAARQAACATPYRVALEVWNEPNLHFQWGYQPVDPVRYTEMVRRAYRGAKAGDPRTLIVAGSLAPTGTLSDGSAMDDVAFLEAMYGAGLKDHFDAISVHNYGFGGAPEDKDAGWGVLNFCRAEDIHAVMVAHGDGGKPVWGTEFGWLLESPECSGYWHSIGFGWQQVTASQQADYLTRAFAYADANWPWMQVMVVSNLDFAVMPWYDTCNPLRWFAVLEPDKTPRPAYTALARMEKRPRSWATWGMDVAPAGLGWMMTVTDTRVVSATVMVRNSGDLAFRWTATLDAADPAQTGIAAALSVAVDPGEGDCDHGFDVTVDARGLPTGTYTTTLLITAHQVEMPDNPRALPIALHIVEQMARVYVPLVQRE